MSKTQTTKKSKTGLIVAIFLVVCLVAAALVMFLPKNNTANSIMQCSTNPNVQFVLDSKNQVIRVNCANSDAEILVSTTNFKGMSAEEAAKKFAELCVQANYLPYNTSGQTITITIYGNEGEDFSEIKNSVKKAVNSYFDENGIIAGAICEISNNFEQALTNIGANASELAGKSKEEILNFIEDTTKNVEDIALSLRDSFYTQYNQLKAQFNVENLTKVVDNIIAQIESEQQRIDSLQKEIDKMPDGIEKIAQQAVLDGYKTALQTLETELEDAKKDLATAIKNFEAELDKKIEELKKRSEEAYNTAKQTLKNKIDEYKTQIEEHKKAFESNKEDIKAQIDAYRQSIEG